MAAKLGGRFSPMISKCANPACSILFHYMREGKLFRMEFDPEGYTPGPQLAAKPRPVRKIEHFWLCGACSATLTLVMNGDKVEIAPLDPVTFRAAAAS
jgi:hypothetical protein